MQSNEKKPTAEALAAATTAPAEAPKPEKAKDVEVVLTSGDWGRHSFRAEEQRIASLVSEQIALAKKNLATKQKVAGIDAVQEAVHEDIRRAKARVAAAEVLEDTAAQAKHQAEVAALEKEVQRLSGERAKAMGLD